MRLHNQQTIKQEQNIVMTPALQQALTVLQLPALELTDYLQEKIKDNPLLELIPPAIAQKNYISNDYSDNPALFTYSEKISLFEHLRRQAGCAFSNKNDITVALYIIDNLDDNGYLTITPESISANLSVSYKNIISVLHKIQKFDPPGVAASSLEECLLLQIDSTASNYNLLKYLIENHLADVGSKSYPTIIEKMKISTEKLFLLLKMLKTLNPLPGQNYTNGSNAVTHYIYPELAIVKRDNQWTVAFYKDSSPKLHINQHYQSLLACPATDPETINYIKKKLTSAQFLIKNLEQRRTNLKKIMQYIVTYQAKYLDYGLQYLRPLSMLQVAKAVGIHESTVSRATSEKYTTSPHGTLAINYFFQPAYSNEASSLDDDLLNRAQSITPAWVKQCILEFVKSENSDNPLSDQEIVINLQAKNIHIARRTVAKYRQQLNISNKKERKLLTL